MSRLIDLTGQRFNRLTVIDLVGFDKYKQSLWRCDCDCGNEKIVTGYRLRSKHTNSCGCLRSEKQQQFIESNRKYTSVVAAQRDAYSRYIYRSKCKKINFELPFIAFQNLIEHNCVYCGAKPENKVIKLTKYRKIQTMINTIDRLDSKKGYTIDNCVSCCLSCNTMKGLKTVLEFLTPINKIAQYQKKQKKRAVSLRKL